MSNFDPNKFLESSISGANSTKVIPCPIGEFQGVIEKIAPRQWQSKDGTQTGVALDVFWLVEDAGVKEQLKRDTVVVKQGIMLDLTPSGELDTSEGKNVGLGRLREAVGKNDPNELFTFTMLPGLMGKIKVGHRVVGEDTYAEVNAVAKL